MRANSVHRVSLIDGEFREIEARRRISISVKYQVPGWYPDITIDSLPLIATEVTVETGLFVVGATG